MDEKKRFRFEQDVPNPGRGSKMVILTEEGRAAAREFFGHDRFRIVGNPLGSTTGVKGEGRDSKSTFSMEFEEL